MPRPVREGTTEVMAPFRRGTVVLRVLSRPAFLDFVWELGELAGGDVRELLFGHNRLAA
jgi:hypothetical protein